MRFKAKLVGVVLASAAISGSAMTLGRAQGAAWIGQRLEISIPVVMTPGLSVSDLCPRVEVFHGDNKVDASRVRVLTENTDRPDTVQIRIYSSAFIDEPVVYLQLHVGCTQEVSRRYVLLAEPPVELRQPQPAPLPAEASAPPPPLAPTLSTDFTPAPAAASSPVESGLGAAGTEIAPRTPVAQPATRSPLTPAVRKASAPKTAAPVRAPGPATRAAAKAPAKAVPPPAPKPAAAGPRLTLDPIETLAERVKTLEATTQSTPLEELVKASERIQQLQTDVKTLQEQAAKNEASLLALQSRLRQAEEKQISSTQVYGLTALLLLALGALGLLWKRRNDRQQAQEDDDEPSYLSHTLSRPSTVSGPSSSTGSEAVTESPKLNVDVNLMEMDEKGFHEVMHTQPFETEGLAKKSAAPVPPAGKSSHPDYNGEAQMAVIDQANFFTTMGKADQAIDTLEDRIRKSPTDSPLAFLTALRIASDNNLKTDFRQFRDEVQSIFNVRVPEFAQFKTEGKGLDAYAGLLPHISELWPSPKVLEVLESCIVRSAWGNHSEPFDLPAFQELVLLHGIATALNRQTDQPSGPAPEADTQHVDLDL